MPIGKKKGREPSMNWVLLKLLSLVRLKNLRPEGSWQLAVRFDSKRSVDRESVEKSLTCEPDVSTSIVNHDGGERRAT